MAESSTFDELPIAKEVQKVIDKVIPELQKATKCQNYLNYLEFDTKHLIKRVCNNIGLAFSKSEGK